MTKQKLKKILNNKDNWEVFEELANERKLELLPTANLWRANLSKADLSQAYFGNRKLVRGNK